MDQSWINTLLNDREPESATLDFKRAVPSKDDASTKSFLKDVAAFANARGGRIVYGIAEDGQGRADNVAPIPTNVDQAAIWLQNKIHRGIFPRMQGVIAQPVHLDSGAVIVLDVPVQYGGPYQVEVGDWRVFPIRAGVGNVEMSYQQLFDAFSLRTANESRIDSWIGTRVAEVAREAKSSGRRSVVVHMVPLSAFHAGNLPDLSALRDHHLRISGSVLINRFNYRGMMATQNSSGTRPVSPYFQFYRNGIVEISWAVAVNNGRDNLLQSAQTTIHLLDLLPQAARAMRLAGVDGPGILAMSYVNAAGQSLYVISSDGQEQHSQPNDEHVLSFGPVIYETLDLSITQLSPIVRNLMTDLFRSFAFDDCFYFESDGTIKSSDIRDFVATYRQTWDAGWQQN